MKKYSDELVRSWWEQLGDISVNEDDEIEEEFHISGVMQFEKGTDKEHIWGWFDDVCEGGLYAFLTRNKL